MTAILKSRVGQPRRLVRSAALTGALGAIFGSAAPDAAAIGHDPTLAERIRAVQERAAAAGIQVRSPEVGGPAIAQWYDWRDWSDGG